MVALRLLPSESLLVTILGLLCSRVRAINQIVAIGDSMTDSCQYGAKFVVDQALNSSKGHPGMPYYEECFFSDGPTYALVAARRLNISLTNYAVGGATAGATKGIAALPAGFGNNTETAIVPLPTSTQQAMTYIKSQNGSIPSDALYIVFIGANDYIGNISGNQSQTVHEVLRFQSQAMDLLYTAGARVFLTQTQPLWGDTPSLQSQGPQLVAGGNLMSRTANAAMGPFLTSFAADHLEASVILFDYATWEQELEANATANGFTSTTGACYSGSFEGNGTGVCDNPEEFIHWDDLHFSGHVHRLWGAAVASQIRPFITPKQIPATSRKLMRKPTRHTVTGDVVYGRPLYAYT